MARRGVNHRHGVGVADGAGDSDYRVVGPVLAVHVMAHVFQADCSHGFGCPAHVAAHGLVGPESAVNEQVAHLRRIVVGHAQLVQNDLTFLLHLRRVKQRVEYQIEQDGYRAVSMDAGDLAPERSHLPVGGRVHHAADALNRL